MKNLEIYIHTPFCVKKCEYCDFLSFPADDETQLRYIKGLMAEMIFYGPVLKDYEVSTIYIGGGTPSWLNEEWIAALMEGIFECFNVKEDAEISIECNPGTLTLNKLLTYRDAGVNRLSIGLQSTNDEELKQDHLKAEAEARELAKQYAPYTVFELRSSCDGRQRQDILPPSIHPDTSKPYVWVTQPRKDWPTPPQWLLTIWSEFEKIKPQLLAACPWAVVDEIYKPSKRSKNTGPSYAGSGGGLVAVVNEFNGNTSIESALENYGYERLGKRYLAPSSQTRWAHISMSLVDQVLKRSAI